MKLIAIDLDGTLLSSDVEITNENIEAIRNAQKEGHVVMICSGRAPEDIKSLLHQYDLDCPVGGSNGTVVYADGKLLSKVSISTEDAASVKGLLDENGIPFKVYTDSGIYIHTSWTERVEALIEQADSIPEQYVKHLDRVKEEPTTTKTEQTFTELEELADQHIQKFFILTLFEEPKARTMEALGEVTTISTTSSGPFNVEVMDQYGNKGNGLKVMADYFNIPMENTVAIGDNLNDVPMLKKAGLSIAMGNADPAVKELCDVTVGTNNESGVAQAFHNHIL
ncbi:HAD family hydrolase [Pontibacillus halophilus JSM 076056 = DSM 19796]|uniref:HAD family hydrolase n=1 Tax=Pontibacillus halophilus JSM 076056 = DSM 19796 TaxID=1385510 RepID=A0A0A5GM49_9BACI|nr:Cof-type HAD-IIB family hydrolase [Pontibacillus halophilus]KGX92245.1 HAD family hydrolase [Pontibacillus halophilus JSM 076056 = DSM 19796]